MNAGVLPGRRRSLAKASLLGCASASEILPLARPSRSRSVSSIPGTQSSTSFTRDTRGSCLCAEMESNRSCQLQVRLDSKSPEAPHGARAMGRLRRCRRSLADARAAENAAATDKCDQLRLDTGRVAQPTRVPMLSLTLDPSRSKADHEKVFQEAARELARRERILQRDRDQLAQERAQLVCERDQLIHQKSEIADERDQLIRERDELAHIQRERDQLVSKLQRSRRSTESVPRPLPYWIDKDMSAVAQKFVWPEGREALHAMLHRTAIHSCCAGRDGTFEIGSVRSVHVWWVENPILWAQYCNKATEMAARSATQKSKCTPLDPPVAGQLAEADLPARLQHQALNKSLNEAFLWHGSSKERVDMIAEAGFDERVSNLGGMLGGGLYFAEDSCKSGQYSQKSIASSRSHWFILSRVLLGKPHYSKMPMPDIRRAPDSCDSVVYTPADDSGLGHHREFVIYDRFQAYPEFIIEARTA